MMRVTGDPFCAVCRQTIRDTYAPFAVPAAGGGVVLETPMVVFNDVPESTTTVRAARFSIDSCVGVTFQVTASPTAPFALESPAVIVASPTGPKPWPAYVWFRFTCDGAGTTHNDAATITCLDTGDVFDVEPLRQLRRTSKHRDPAGFRPIGQHARSYRRRPAQGTGAARRRDRLRRSAL